MNVSSTAALLSKYVERFEGDEWIPLDAFSPGEVLELPEGIFLDLTGADRTRLGRLVWGKAIVSLPITRASALEYVQDNPPSDVVTSLDLVCALASLLGKKAPTGDPDWGMGRKRQMRCWKRLFKEAD